jgi:hypothetical protein
MFGLANGTSPYAHLLKGAAGDLECVSCLEIDDLGKSISLESFFIQALSFFHAEQEQPKRVSYLLRDNARPRRASPSTFQNKVIDRHRLIPDTVTYVKITGRGFELNDKSSEEWTPRVEVAAAKHGSVTSLFLFGPTPFQNLIDFF